MATPLAPRTTAEFPPRPRTLTLIFSNLHEMHLPRLVQCLMTDVEPLAVDWLAQKTSKVEPRAEVAAAHSAEFGFEFTKNDIVMTRGVFGAIALAFDMLLDRGDECIFPAPG